MVRIEVRLSADSPEARQGGMQDIPAPFRQFFNLPDQGQQQEAPARFASGTGFLVSDDGYIVTNNHVAGDADEITVTLQDHRSFKAKLVGADPTTDVAVIKIDAKDLPHLSWGNSTNLRVGEWVMAIGNPGYGSADQLDYTVTTGIVSGKGRPLQLLQQGLAQDPRFGAAKANYAIEDFIQTDAVINPGNSGGPLVDLDGQVIGMNSAIASTDGHYQGYGFAIPSDLVKKVANDLMAHGKVERAWLGVAVTGVSPEDAEAFHLPAVRGVVVQSVTDGGPAADAGLKMGDVITMVDGRDIDSGGNLQVVVATHSQGDKIDVQYYRDGKAHDATVKLGDAPLTRDSQPVTATRHREEAASQKLGLTLTDLDAATAQRLGYDDPHGVVVRDVDPAGPAARRGVAPGTELVRIGREGGDVGRAGHGPPGQGAAR